MIYETRPTSHLMWSSGASYRTLWVACDAMGLAHLRQRPVGSLLSGSVKCQRDTRGHHGHPQGHLCLLPTQLDTQDVLERRSHVLHPQGHVPPELLGQKVWNVSLGPARAPRVQLSMACWLADPTLSPVTITVPARSLKGGHGHQPVGPVLGSCTTTCSL